MQLQWNQLLAALAIVCIIEGVMPFIYPGALKRLLGKLSATRERELRIMGFLSIVVGLLLLFAVRS
jgi:uncharacterized protein